MADTRYVVTRFTGDSSGFSKAVKEMMDKVKELNKELTENKQKQKETSKEIKDAEKELKKTENAVKKSGTATEEQKRKIEELKKTISGGKEQLELLKQGEERLKVAIAGTNDKIKAHGKALADVKSSTQNIIKGVQDLTKQIAALGIAGAAAFAGLYKYIGDAAAWADDLDTLSDKTGIATDDLQKFMYASELVDVSVETMTGSLTRLTKAMQTAKNSPGGSIGKIFDTLNVDAVDKVTGQLRDRQEVFYELINALGKVGNETERDAMALELFGKSAEEINPLIKGGAETIRQMGEEAEKAGLILDKETISRLHAFNDGIDTLKSKGSQIQKITASEMLPAIESVTAVADELLNDINEMSKTGELEARAKEIGQIVRKGAEGLKNLLEWLWKNKEAVAAVTAAVVAFKIALTVTSLINSLVIGLKAMKTAEDGAAASTAALNVMLNANPIGIVISLVAALAVGLGVYAAAAGTAKTETDRFNESLNNLQESADSNIAKIQAETETAKILASQYDELRKKTSLTAEEKERLKTITEQLAGYFGTTVEDLKDETGEWKDLTTAIEEHNKKLVEAAELKAYQDMLTEAIKTMNEMQDKMASGIGGKEFNDAKKAYDEASEAAERYRFYLEKIGTVSDESLNKIIDLDRQIKQAENNAQHDRTSGWQDWADGLKKQREELVKQLQNTEKQTTAAGAAFEKATEKEKKDAEGLKQLADELNDTADAEENLQEKLTEANKKVEENQVAITKQRAAMKEAYKAFDDYVTALLRGDEGHTLEEARKLYDAYQSELDKLAQLKTAQTDYKKAVSDLTAEYKKQSETLDDVVKESQKLRSEMSSLSSAYATLEKGQAMDYSTLLDLIDKYPEYAGRLLQARDNIDLQKSAVSMLFDAKKQEFILSQQIAIDKIKSSNEETTVFLENTQAQIRALNDQKRVFADMKGILGENAVSIALAQAESMAADLQKKIDQIRSYQKRIDWVKSLTVKDFTSPSAASGTSDTSASRSVDAKVQYWRSGYGVKAFGDTELDAALAWLDRVQALDKITTSQVIGHLKQWKADYARTADEIYDIDHRIYQAQQKLESEQQAQVQKRLDLVKAAYEKMAEDRIALYKKQSDAAKEAADKEIKALDELKKKRQEDQDDAKRKAELDAVNIQLRYKHLDEISRLELLRKKQDLINEQKEIDFERQLELKKQQLQAGADLTIAQYDRAIGSINELLERLSYFVAQQSGTVTNQQIINNNNSRQNFQIVQGGLSSQQLVAEINRALYSG